MEFLFNLVWVLLSVALVFRWLRAEVHDGSFRSNWKLRAIALVLIIFVLLPAVSLTDDLQANARIAESEHIARRLELLVSGELQSLEASLIPILAVAIHPLFASSQRIFCEDAGKREQAGIKQLLDTRPPPAL